MAVLLLCDFLPFVCICLLADGCERAESVVCLIEAGRYCYADLLYYSLCLVQYRNITSCTLSDLPASRYSRAGQVIGIFTAGDRCGRIVEYDEDTFKNIER